MQWLKCFFTVLIYNIVKLENGQKNGQCICWPFTKQVTLGMFSMLFSCCTLCEFIPFPVRRWALMEHLYLSPPDRCGQKIHKSKGDRQCKIVQKENVCLFCSYVFSVRTSQAERGINAPWMALKCQNLERNGIQNETFECLLMPRN